MNLTAVLDLFNALPAYQQLLRELAQGQSLAPLGLPRAARAPLAARLYLSHQQPTLILTGRVENVSLWRQALESWLPPGWPILRFPEPTPLPYERGAWGERSRFERLNTLAQLTAVDHPLLPAPAQPPLIITSARALLQKTLPRRRFVTATRTWRVGQRLELEKQLAEWLRIGYEPVSVVESPGQFSRRGGIIDIFPAAAPLPVRIELFDDEIDSLRYFNPTTQRSTDLPAELDSQVEYLLVTPAREALPGDTRPLGEALAAVALAAQGELPGWPDDIPGLTAEPGQPERTTPHLEYYLPMLYPQPDSLLDYLPEKSLLLVDDEAELLAAVYELHQQSAQIAQEQSSLPPGYPCPLFDADELTNQLSDRLSLDLGESGTDDQRLAINNHLTNHFQPGPRFGGQVRPFLTHLRQAQHSKEPTIVVSRQAARLAELWREEMGGAGPAPLAELRQLPDDNQPAFVQGSLAEGFTLVDPGSGRDNVIINLLTDAEVFGWNRPAPSRRRAVRPLAPEAYFADISAGDYVVHLEFGVGQFMGLVVRFVGGTEREYLQIKYTNGDVLYVPVHQADRLSKWIGSEERPPTMHRLGEKSWKAAKSRAFQAANELAEELLDLYARRETIAGHAFAADTDWQAELEASFPYQETEDQLRVIAEVKADMERPQPMDRLVCGDVGYGKTEVALRAAFKAVMDNKQVAILVPTTVLAQQHYNTFSQRLRPFPVTVEMLSRFRTSSQQERIIKKLREGQVDIVIGTHRLLSDDVAFKDLGLVIIDEEQRFGVNHKETLKKWRTEVDVLTMTATPIPRTLYLGLAGVRDISSIDTAPAERMPVQTYVGELDDNLLKRAIRRELDRGGQIYFVHNRVQSIEIIHKQVAWLVPEAAVAVGHGQMSERELEEIMLQFAEGAVDILLSTTIIESGLDIPNANTLIVNRAEQFGLAQLYQLRGRVGRGTRQAHAYFFHSPWRSLNPDAQARLNVIAEETQLGAGYSIAMRDLEIRGAGEILGARQTGHVATVGFDLYMRLLAQAVKNKKARRETGLPEGDLALALPEAALIDLPLATYIPPDYTPDAGLRLRLYRRMALLTDLASIDEMAAELADRFGPIPDPVHNLLYQLRIKALAMAAGATAVISDTGQIQIRLPYLNETNRFSLQRQLGAGVRVSRSAVWLSLNVATHDWQVNLVQILERLAESKPAAGEAAQAAAPN
jgi:transcription-repair coupling factor (superfamily II helicase)